MRLSGSFHLKRKDSRLRDWNAIAAAGTGTGLDTLEKKRFSITRLKPHAPFAQPMKDRATWKEKILDYEIETFKSQPS